MIEGIR
jgi:Ca2+-binding EF-hand superfamily protein